MTPWVPILIIIICSILLTIFLYFWRKKNSCVSAENDTLLATNQGIQRHIDEINSSITKLGTNVTSMNNNIANLQFTLNQVAI